MNAAAFDWQPMPPPCNRCTQPLRTNPPQATVLCLDCLEGRELERARRYRAIESAHFDALPVPARILYVLRQYPNRTVPYGHIIERVWGHQRDRYFMYTLRTNVAHLRKGLRPGTYGALLPNEKIVNVNRTGYRLVVVEEVQ